MQVPHKTKVMRMEVLSLGYSGVSPPSCLQRRLRHNLKLLAQALLCRGKQGYEIPLEGLWILLFPTVLKSTGVRAGRLVFSGSSAADLGNRLKGTAVFFSDACT